VDYWPKHPVDLFQAYQKLENSQENFRSTEGIKVEEDFGMEKVNVNHRLWRMSRSYDKGARMPWK
jgi:hypothetical protein